MRKGLYILHIFLLSLTLIACEPSELDQLKEVLGDVSISYQTPDNNDSVTQDLELITTIGDVTISWSSSHPDIISSSGEVNRPNNNTTVTLTATLTLGQATETLTFTLDVIAIEIVIDLLEHALSNMDLLDSYTMNITFETDEDSYPVTVKIAGSLASIEAFDETIYYEIDNNICYVYELEQALWTKTEVTCSEKGTTELAFLSGFSKDYFIQQQDGEITFYVLKMDYYQSLQSFLNSSMTSNFKLTLSNGYIDTIWMTMLRDDITFDVTIELRGLNQTTVVLPEITT
jgi:hypothetical protein